MGGGEVERGGGGGGGEAVDRKSGWRREVNRVYLEAGTPVNCWIRFHEGMLLLRWELDG